MKIKNTFRYFLTLLLIVSNLSVAFSMHLCEGNIETIKLNDFLSSHDTDTSCCPLEKHCNTENNKDQDCCTDIIVTDNDFVKRASPIFTLNPIVFNDTYVFSSFVPFYIVKNYLHKNILDFYVETNAPPIYITYSKLIFYEG